MTHDEAATLLHEAMHGIIADRCHGLELPEIEQFVDSMARGTLALLRENKGLADYLINPDK